MELEERLVPLYWVDSLVEDVTIEQLISLYDRSGVPVVIDGDLIARDRDCGRW